MHPAGDGERLGRSTRLQRRSCASGVRLDLAERRRLDRRGDRLGLRPERGVLAGPFGQAFRLLGRLVDPELIDRLEPDPNLGAAELVAAGVQVVEPGHVTRVALAGLHHRGRHLAERSTQVAARGGGVAGRDPFLHSSLPV